jgi:hypothetical protein
MTWSIVDKLMRTALVAVMRGRLAMTELLRATVSAAFALPEGVARAVMCRPRRE